MFPLVTLLWYVDWQLAAVWATYVDLLAAVCAQFIWDVFHWRLNVKGGAKNEPIKIKFKAGLHLQFPLQLPTASWAVMNSCWHHNHEVYFSARPQTHQTSGNMDYQDSTRYHASYEQPGFICMSLPAKWITCRVTSQGLNKVRLLAQRQGGLSTEYGMVNRCHEWQELCHLPYRIPKVAFMAGMDVEVWKSHLMASSTD